MTRVLIVEESARVVRILKSGLENEFMFQIDVALDEEAMREMLSENEYQLIICRNKIDTIDIAQICQTIIYDKEQKVPIVVIGETSIVGNNIYHISDRFVIEELFRLIVEAKHITKEMLAEIKRPEFLPISLPLIKMLKKYPCDIYVRINKSSGNQFVKRILAGDVFEEETLNRYQRSSLDEVYIHKEERIAFLNEVILNCWSNLEAENPTPKQITSVLSNNFDVGHELIRSLGVDEKTQMIVNRSVQNMLDTLKGSDRLADLLKELMSSTSSYAFKHSQLIAMIGWGILTKLDWGEEKIRLKNFERLVYAAYLHDIFLKTNDRLVMIDSKMDMIKAKLNEQETELVNNHAYMSASLFANMKRGPSGVEIILKQHHGSTNGVGFPDYYSSSLSQLVVIFILLEYLSRRILTFKVGTDKLVNVFKDMEQTFTQPTYRRLIQTIKESITEWV